MLKSIPKRNFENIQKLENCVLESLLVGIYLFEEDLIYVNSKFSDFFGFQREEIDQTPEMMKKLIPENYTLVYQQFQKIRQGILPSFFFKFEGMTKKGEKVFGESHASLYQSEGRNWVIGYIRSISHEKKLNQEIEKLFSFPEENINPVIEIDIHGKITYANKSALKTFPDLNQKEGNHPVLSEVVRIIHSREKEKISDFLEVSFQGKHYEERVFFLENFGMFKIYLIDITERKKAEERLFLEDQMFQNTTEGILITDSKGIIISVNPAFTTITGYKMEEVLGESPRILKSDRHNDDFYQQMWDAILNDGKWQGEIWNRKKDGTAYLEWLTINLIKDKNDEIIYYISIFNDISNIKKFEKNIDFLANYDPLTGLGNRVLFQDKLYIAISQSEDLPKNIAILLFNLDRFKKINDTLGNIIGDLVLIETAARLKKVFKDNETLSRVGGDDFAVVLDDFSNLQDTVRISEQVLQAVSEPYQIHHHELFISMSIGISLYPFDGENLNQLQRNSELAMNRAKQNGGAQYQFFEPHMNVQAIENLLLENKLRKALVQNEFLVYYQPQIDVKTEKLIGAEALIRWKEPDLGIVPPDKFIPLAEEIGLIIPIGMWVFNTVAEHLEEWISQGMENFNIAVNLSGIQFRQEDLVLIIAQVLKEKKLDPKYLVLEITETITMNNLGNVIMKLRQIKALGIKIAMDDFGTGYSSLSYLKDFPIDKLKIDKSFMKDIPKNKQDIAIIETIITLGHSLGLEVVAEGVETQEQLDLLREKGCDIIQGYFYGKPMPKEQFEKEFLKF